MNINPAKYFTKYRLELGFSNQSSTKIFLSAKDVKPSINYEYIEQLNVRLIEILRKINLTLQEDYRQKNIDEFAHNFIHNPYEVIKNNSLLPKLNNQGRRPEQVIFSWLRGFVIVEFFSPMFAKLFDVNITSITKIGSDDFSNIETFKRTATADLAIQKNNNIIRIEVQSGFQGANDVKEHKVREAKQIFIEKNIKTICIHIDIFNGQVAFIQLDNIKDDNVNWITRQQMEGQTVFTIEQNYFKWRLLDKLPKFTDLEFNL